MIRLPWSIFQGVRFDQTKSLICFCKNLVFCGSSGIYIDNALSVIGAQKCPFLHQNKFSVLN